MLYFELFNIFWRVLLLEIFRLLLVEKIDDKATKNTEALEDATEALNKDLKVAEAGLNDGANIFVVNTEGVKGA